MNQSFTYTGHELEVMNNARNYHKWILSAFKSYLASHVVEVGAGVGSFSELILAHHTPQTFSLVEPSAHTYEELCVRIKQFQTDSKTVAYHGTFRDVVGKICKAQSPDTVIYVNVLEHVEDDIAELDAVHDALTAGGHVLIFVPALPWLYGSFDKMVGHFRRYRKSELEHKLRKAGFKIVHSRYFDFAGVIPWWIKYRILQESTMEPGAVKFYDQFIVPSMRRVETLMPVLIGKNLIAVGKKRV
ncbi:MAG: class I SAM-dependent methyltransferase [Pyrinomonadaceae bacterium]